MRSLEPNGRATRGMSRTTDPACSRASPPVWLRLQNDVALIAINHNHRSADGIPAKVVNKPAWRRPILFFEIMEELPVKLHRHVRVPMELGTAAINFQVVTVSPSLILMLRPGRLIANKFRWLYQAGAQFSPRAPDGRSASGRSHPPR
jgi:hypothetical protein